MRMVVTAAPGGITDILGRLVAEQVQKSTGQAMVVENRTGAGGNIGTQFVAKSTPDGYTMGIANVGNFCINRWLYKDMGFDPINDLMGVALVADGPSIIGVWDKLPPKTLKELVAYGKSSGNKLNYGSAGTGQTLHLMGEILTRSSSVKLNHVPYKGTALGLADVIAGHLQLTFDAIRHACARPHAQRHHHEAQSRDCRTHTITGYSRAPHRPRARATGNVCRGKRPPPASGPPKDHVSRVHFFQNTERLNRCAP